MKKEKRTPDFITLEMLVRSGRPLSTKMRELAFDSLSDEERNRLRAAAAQVAMRAELARQQIESETA